MEETGLEIVDDENVLTKSELASLKRIAKMWNAGTVMVSVILGLGAFSVACVQLWDVITRGTK